MSSLLGGFAGLGGGTIGRASVDLVLNASSYQGQLAAAEGETKAATGNMSKGFAGFQQSVRSSFSGAQVAMVGFGAVAALAIGKAVSATTDWAAQVRSLQRVTGQTAESASALAGAGSLLGLDVTQLTTGFGLLEKNIVNASANLTKYGIATKDASGNVLPFDDVLAAVSDKFSTLQAGPEQAAFAMNVFGRSGKALIPILQQGSSGLADLEQRAKDAGLVMSGADVEAAKKLTIAQHELADAVKGAEIQIGTQFLPVLTRLAGDLTGLIEITAKIPGPVKAGALAFIALNGALVAIRGVWGVLSGIIEANAGALGAHTAAAEADAVAVGEDAAALQAASVAAKENAGATLMAVGPMKLLNAGIVENIAGLAALAKGTQDAVSEWDNVKAGNFSGALHDITSELHFYTAGLVATTRDTTSFTQGLTQIDEQLKAGTLSAADATTQAQALAAQFGVTLPQAVLDYINAQGGATTATDAGTTSLGGMTEAAYKAAAASGQLSQAQKDLKSSVATTAEGLLTLSGSVKKTFDISLAEENKGFASMLASALRFKADMKQLESLKFGLDKNNMVAFEKFMADQGPGYVDRFVNASKAKQQQWVNEWQKSAGAVNSTIAGVGRQMAAINNQQVTVHINTSAIDAAAQKLHGIQQAMARGL